MYTCLTYWRIITDDRRDCRKRHSRLGTKNLQRALLPLNWIVLTHPIDASPYPHRQLRIKSRSRTFPILGPFNYLYQLFLRFPDPPCLSPGMPFPPLVFFGSFLLLPPTVARVLVDRPPYRTNLANTTTRTRSQDSLASPSPFSARRRKPSRVKSLG